MNLAKKLITILMVLAIPFSLISCNGDTSWAFNVDGTKIPTGVYILYLMDARSQVNSKNTDTTKDAWSQTIDGKDAVKWAEDYAKQKCEELIYTEKEFKKRGLKLTDEENTSIDTSINQYETNYGSQYKAAGVEMSSVERLMKVSKMQEKLFNAIYGAGGEKAVSDTDLQNEFKSKYVRVKHILVPTVDVNNNNTPLSDADKAKAKTTADTVFTKAQAAKDDAAFLALVTENNQDPGMNADPASRPDGPNKEMGYIITKEKSGMVESYEKAAAALKAGDVTKIEDTTYGFFIIKGYDLMENNGKYFNLKKADVLKEMKSTDFETYLKDQANSLNSKTTSNPNTLKLFKVKGLPEISQAQ